MADNVCRVTNKVRHRNKEKALEAIFEIRLRSLSNNGRAEQGREAKFCPHCLGFHVVAPSATPGKATRS